MSNHQTDTCQYGGRQSREGALGGSKKGTELHAAALEGDLTLLNRLLDEGADPNVEVTNGIHQGETPLHWAAIGNAPDAVERLLSAGANVGATDREGWTPLHRTAWWDRPAAAAALLEAGANPEVRADQGTRDGGTPLRWAVLGDSPAVAKRLLRAGADPHVEGRREAEVKALAALKASLAASMDAPEVLTRLATDQSADVREAVALNDNTPEDVLRDLAAGKTPSVRGAASNHPKTPEDLLALFEKAGSRTDLTGSEEGASGPLTSADRNRLMQAGPYGRELLAAHPNTSTESLRRLVEDGSADVRRAAASNPNLPPAVAWSLAREYPEAVLANPARRFWTAENPLVLQDVSLAAVTALLKCEQAPEQWLQWGTKHESETVRFAVAQNPAVPAEILKALAGDSNEHVRRAVSRHTNVPQDVLELLATAGSTPDLFSRADRGLSPLSAEERRRLLKLGMYGRKLVAAHPGTPEAMLEKLLRKGGREVVHAVLANPSAPARLLREGIQDAEIQARKIVANNPSAPPDVLERLAADRRAAVRMEVISHSRSPEEFFNLMTRAGSALDLSERTEKPPEPITETERERLLQAGPFGRELVAAHPETPEHVLRNLAGTDDRAVQAALASNPKAPEERAGAPAK